MSSKAKFISCYSLFKGIDNEKRGGLKVAPFDRSRFKLFTLRFSNKSVQAPLVRGVELLSEACFCHLKSIIASKYRHIVGLRHTFNIIHLIEITVLYILPDI